MNILFVCTGNTCRSPMAEGLFKDMLKKNKISDISVSSAGISALPGGSANEKAVAALEEKGIDIRGHKSRQLSEDNIMKMDLILTMTSAHKKLIESFFVNDLEDRPKIFTLKEFAGKISGGKVPKDDIKDPFGRDYKVYKKIRDEIEKELIKIIKNIDKLEEV